VMLVLQPADIIITHSVRGWLGKTIRFFERRPGNTAWGNHVGICTSGGLLQPIPGHTHDSQQARMAEALGRVREGRVWDFYGPPVGSDRPLVTIYRPISLTPNIQNAIAIRALSKVGLRYAWWELGYQAADWWLSMKAEREVYLFRYLQMGQREICSGLIAWAVEPYRELGLTFGVPAGAVPNPDQIDDWCANHPKHYCTIIRRGLIA
jgi:hypothetical protein